MQASPAASVRLADHRIVAGILTTLGLLNQEQRDFIQYARGADIRWADVRRRIPEEDGSIDTVYSSHMIEHLALEPAYLNSLSGRKVAKVLETPFFVG